jgi:energy-coupling factor transporter transmembrane protein EcfT
LVPLKTKHNLNFDKLIFIIIYLTFFQLQIIKGKYLLIIKIIGIIAIIVHIIWTIAFKYDSSKTNNQNEYLIINDNTRNLIHSIPKTIIEFFQSKSKMKFLGINLEIITKVETPKNQFNNIIK